MDQAIRYFVVLFFFVALPLPATATATSMFGGELDQAFVPTGTGGSILGGEGLIHAQTFNSGISGQLRQIDVFVHTFNGVPPDDLRVRILGISPSGKPDIDDEIARVVLLPVQVASEPGTFLSIDLRAFDIQVEVGTSLAIALDTGSVLRPGYSWLARGDNPYKGGNLFISHNSGATFLASGQTPGVGDVGFRTFVGVPEPGTLALLLGATCSAAIRPRRWN